MEILHFFLTWLHEDVWQVFLNGFCVSFVLPGLLIFLLLVLFGGFLRSFGLPRLFWKDGMPFTQVFIGVGVAALVWQILLAGYLFEEFATNYTIDRSPFCETRLDKLHPEKTLSEVRFRYPPADVW